MSTNTSPTTRELLKNLSLQERRLWNHCRDEIERMACINKILMQRNLLPVEHDENNETISPSEIVYCEERNEPQTMMNPSLTNHQESLENEIEDSDIDENESSSDLEEEQEEIEIKEPKKLSIKRGQADETLDQFLKDISNFISSQIERSNDTFDIAGTFIQYLGGDCLRWFEGWVGNQIAKTLTLEKCCDALDSEFKSRDFYSSFWFQMIELPFNGQDIQSFVLAFGMLAKQAQIEDSTVTNEEIVRILRYKTQEFEDEWKRYFEEENEVDYEQMLDYLLDRRTRRRPQLAKAPTKQQPVKKPPTKSSDRRSSKRVSKKKETTVASNSKEENPRKKLKLEELDAKQLDKELRPKGELTDKYRQKHLTEGKCEVIDGQIEYEIEKILAERVKNRKKEYLVKWRYFPVEESEWLAASDLKHAKEAVLGYQRTKLQSHKN